MNFKPCCLYLATALIALTSGVSFAVPLQPGREIGVDLGFTPTTNWNNFSTSMDLTAGNVIALDGNVVDNVDILVTGVTSFSNAGLSNWAGLATNGGSAPPEFVDSVTSDFGQRFTTGQLFVFISGLPAGLTYNLYLATVAPVGVQTDVVNVNQSDPYGPSYGPSSITRAASSGGAFHSFLGIQADSQGYLDIRVIDPTQSNPALAGLLLVAVPEPATLTLTATGMAALTFAMVRRRRTTSAR